MRLLGLLSISLLVLTTTEEGIDPRNCTRPSPAEDELCAQPIEDVTAVTPGSFYTAKIRCHNCPYLQYTGEGADRERQKLHGDNDLFLRVTLSQDNRTVYFNDQPVFPNMKTIPVPPNIHIPQLRPTFSYKDLSEVLRCPKPSCLMDFYESLRADCRAWCVDLQLDLVSVDYLYINRMIDYDGGVTDADVQHWELGLDIISGNRDDSEWVFENPSQKMVKIIVAGTELKQGSQRGPKDSSLFGSTGDEEKVYTYQIMEVKLADREYNFPAKEPLTFRQKLTRFFGNDIWVQGRLVYVHNEWGMYGKEGTLRDMFGELVHWPFWDIVWISLGATVAAVLLLLGSYKLYFWILQQRELIRWNGIDDVWDKLRREREEEENALLNGGYRDEPEEGGSPRSHFYTDDCDTMKPLPSKPLPDKPLPDVPLIDA